MASQQPHGTDPIALLTELVRDHEKRLRWIERVLWSMAGATVSGGGTYWITIIMTRR